MIVFRISDNQFLCLTLICATKSINALYNHIKVTNLCGKYAVKWGSYAKITEPVAFFLYDLECYFF